jgi:hypothetical protein
MIAAPDPASVALVAKTFTQEVVDQIEQDRTGKDFHLDILYRAIRVIDAHALPTAPVPSKTTNMPGDLP